MESDTLQILKDCRELLELLTDDNTWIDSSNGSLDFDLDELKERIEFTLAQSLPAKETWEQKQQREIFEAQNNDEYGQNVFGE